MVVFPNYEIYISDESIVNKLNNLLEEFGKTLKQPYDDLYIVDLQDILNPLTQYINSLDFDFFIVVGTGGKIINDGLNINNFNTYNSYFLDITRSKYDNGNKVSRVAKGSKTVSNQINEIQNLFNKLNPNKVLVLDDILSTGETVSLIPELLNINSINFYLAEGLGKCRSSQVRTNRISPVINFEETFCSNLIDFGEDAEDKYLLQDGIKLFSRYSFDIGYLTKYAKFPLDAQKILFKGKEILNKVYAENKQEELKCK